MMTSTLHTFTGVLAQSAVDQRLEERARHIFGNWPQSNDVFPASTLGWILLALLMVLLAIWLKQWYKNRPIDPTPNRLFRKLARQLQLGLWDQWLLLRIAREQQLPSPLTLLLSRSTLLHHGSAYAAEVVAVRSPWIRKRVEKIAVRLFGSSAQQAERDILAAMLKAGFSDTPAAARTPAASN
jgi:hypothetical protein